ncbi:hypothetical protein HAX54_017371 [Datura stramonium]|uniref:Uncharacterized protein n=1 Tax=Datura stramonium TaxID=4076 RepID=A0ABS8S131_DATST|nr:hypothetical protein [Datura stramonium]
MSPSLSQEGTSISGKKLRMKTVMMQLHLTDFHSSSAQRRRVFSGHSLSGRTANASRKAQKPSRSTVSKLRSALTSTRGLGKAVNCQEEPIWRTYCNGRKCGYARKENVGLEE